MVADAVPPPRPAAGRRPPARSIGTRAGHRGCHEFPPGYLGFHTYAEMANEVAATAQAYPAIVRHFSIGTSNFGARSGRRRSRQRHDRRGRTGGPVRRPPPRRRAHEPGDDARHPALADDGYGKEATITRLVNTREIWIVFGMNPDGATYTSPDASGTTGGRTVSRHPVRRRSARISIGTTTIAGAVAVGRARARPAPGSAAGRVLGAGDAGAP